MDTLNHDYIFPEKAKSISEKLMSKETLKQLNQTSELDEFINVLALLIRNVSKDNYLDIVENNNQIFIDKTPINSTYNNADNFGFAKVEILSGNIGYMKVNYFYQNQSAALYATQAFDYLSKTDALIIDLRNAEGNSISLAQHMMSVFVKKNSLLAKVVYDKQTKTKELIASGTLNNVSFKQNFPVYILTSSFVSGTGEFFSYTLKHLDKAVIVGEQTMGVALISKKYQINEYISVNMPVAMPIHPVTNTNWEQQGVIPDYMIEAKLSFDFAYKLAKQTLMLF